LLSAYCFIQVRKNTAFFRILSAHLLRGMVSRNVDTGAGAMQAQGTTKATDWAERVARALAQGEPIADDDRQNLARVLRGQRPAPPKASAPAEWRGFYRIDEVLSLTNVSRTTLWRWEKQGRFPRRVILGPHRVGWRKTEVRLWAEDPQAYADAQLAREDAELARAGSR
jgi:prophage regulatory protein